MAKKKSKTPTLLLAGGAAALAFFLFRRTASASDAVLPVTPPDGGDDTGPPVEPPESEPVVRDAPPMGMSTAQAVSAGTLAAMTYVDQVNAIVEAEIRSTLEPEFAGPLPEALAADVAPARSTLGIPGGRTIASWITDQAYFGLFGESKIPAPANRGSGWQPYIDTWTAIWGDVKAALLRGVNNH